MNLCTLGRSYNSNLLRLRKWFQKCVFNRKSGIDLLTHVSLYVLLEPVFASHGFSAPIAFVVSAAIAIVVANVINDCLDKGAES